MKKLFVTFLLASSISALAQVSNDSERLRISKERAALDAAFSLEDTACYKRFMVNNCLDEVRSRRSDATADLRRQEILINDQERKARGAEQIQKTEDKASPEKLQQAADKSAEAVRDYEDRIERDQQKAADRLKLESNEKANLDAAAARAQSAQDKASGRTARQAAAAGEVKKYNERLQRAKDRQARITNEKASQTKPPANALPAAP